MQRPILLRYFTNNDGKRTLELYRFFGTYRIIDRTDGKMRQSRHDSLADAVAVFDAKVRQAVSR